MKKKASTKKFRIWRVVFGPFNGQVLKEKKKGRALKCDFSTPTGKPISLWTLALDFLSLLAFAWWSLSFFSLFFLLSSSSFLSEESCFFFFILSEILFFRYEAQYLDY